MKRRDSSGFRASSKKSNWKPAARSRASVEHDDPSRLPDDDIAPWVKPALIGVGTITVLVVAVPLLYFFTPLSNLSESAVVGLYVNIENEGQIIRLAPGGKFTFEQRPDFQADADDDAVQFDNVAGFIDVPLSSIDIPYRIKRKTIVLDMSDVPKVGLLGANYAFPASRFEVRGDVIYARRLGSFRKRPGPWDAQALNQAPAEAGADSDDANAADEP